MKKIAWNIIAFSSLILTSCAGSKAITKKAFSADISQYQSVAVSVDENVGEDVTEEMKTLERLTVRELEKRGAFAKVVTEVPEGATQRCLRANATITHIRKVSGGARFWGGAFAGKAELRLDLTFADASTDEILGQYEVTGLSGSTGMSGGTGSAIEGAAVQIADIVAEQREKDARK